jgi:hypothetical protein
MNNHLNDQQLCQLVRQSWTASPKSDPGFRAAVWARIEAGRRLPATWSAWLKANLASVTVYAAASVVVAGTGGGLLAANQAGRERDQLIQRYVASIDPHQRANAQGNP